MAQAQVHDEPGRSRYVAVLDGQEVGVAEYVVAGPTITFTHTVVDPGHQHRGVGSALVAASLDDVRRRGLRVVPRCPFYAAWFEDHPETADLLAPRPDTP